MATNCPTSTMKVTNVAFNGINHDPISKTAMIKLGGATVDGGETTESGRFFGGIKIEGAEVEFEVPLTADFDPDNYRGQCGDLQFLTDIGINYLVTNATCAANIEMKSGESKVKLTFKGDAATRY